MRKPLIYVEREQLSRTHHQWREASGAWRCPHSALPPRMWNKNCSRRLKSWHEHTAAVQSLQRPSGESDCLGIQPPATENVVSPKEHTGYSSAEKGGRGWMQSTGLERASWCYRQLCLSCGDRCIELSKHNSRRHPHCTTDLRVFIRDPPTSQVSATWLPEDFIPRVAWVSAQAAPYRCPELSLMGEMGLSTLRRRPGRHHHQELVFQEPPATFSALPLRPSDYTSLFPNTSE